MILIGNDQEENNITPFYVNEVTKAQPTFDLGVRDGFVTTSTTEKGTSGKFFRNFISVEIHVYRTRIQKYFRKFKKFPHNRLTRSRRNVVCMG